MKKLSFAIVSLITITAVTSAAVSQNNTQKAKPAVTKTSLHIARSLDPSETEYLNIKSKNGEIATLLVKKREGRKTFSTFEEARREAKNMENAKISDAPLVSRAPKSEQAVPPPVEIRSGMMYVKDEANASKKKGRNLQTMKIDHDGIPIIEGVREPDSAEDKVQTWRNARVINGVLVPYKQSLTSEIPLKSKEIEHKHKPEKQEVVVSSYFETDDRKSSMFGDDDAIKTQWKGIAETLTETQKPAEKIKNIPLKYEEPDPNQAKIIEYIMKINQKEMQNRRKGARSIDYLDGASRRMDENVDENEEPIWVNTQPQEIWTEDGKISVANRRADQLGEKEQVVDMSDSQIKDDKFVPIAPVEARLLHPQGVSNYPTSTLYSNQPSRVSFEEGVRTPVLQYAHPELGAQPAKVDNAAEETESSRSDHSQSSVPSLTYFSNDPYADRSPYAYEPGLRSQSEDTLTASSNFHAQDVSNNLGVSQERENGGRHSNIQNIEFTTAASEGVSINPDEIDITESPNRLKTHGYLNDNYRDTYGLAGDKYIKRYPYSNYHGNSYPMTKEEYYKWKMSGMSYGNNHNQGYYVKIPDNRPFWEKITDSIKETVQSGVESMKDLTRPVMEPIVEATQRISENLGIHEATAKISNTLGLNQGTGMRTALQEKVGAAAAASSPVLLPALGLVAGGAALGLGAVAMGRLLDVNVNLLKRSESGDVSESALLQAEHKRALEGVNSLPESLKNMETIAVLPGVQHVNSNEKETNSRAFTNDMVIIADGNNLVKKSEGESVVLVPVKLSKSLPMTSENKNAEEKDSKTEFKRLIDESGIEGLEKFNFNINEGDDEHKSRRRSLITTSTESHNRRKRQTKRSRRRRAPFNLEHENDEYLDNILRNGEANQEALLAKMATLGHPNAWSSTPCAKKIFCDVMVKQSHDSVLLMEKKMATFLSL